MKMIPLGLERIIWNKYVGDASAAETMRDNAAFTQGAETARVNVQHGDGSLLDARKKLDAFRSAALLPQQPVPVSGLAQFGLWKKPSEKPKTSLISEALPRKKI